MVNWTNRQTTSLEKRTVRQKALGNYGEHCEESIGVFGRSAEEIACAQPKISVLRAQKYFPIKVGLTDRNVICFNCFAVAAVLCFLLFFPPFSLVLPRLYYCMLSHYICA